MAELEPRNFLQPCLLLLLRERPDHGYELAARLRPMHDGEGDAGGVYRALRGMERQGLVRSEWHTSDVGPAKRTYFVTPDGVSFLDELAVTLSRTHEALHVFLDRYARVVAAATRGTAEGSNNGHRTDQRPEQRVDTNGNNGSNNNADRCGRNGGVQPARRPDRTAGR
ncbi:PadR family transcriptional regulator [Pseudonocardia aurantiaca]|uniref:PadR family transcriptional regulator n=1 Tax=Pseudonocardia aurantiaca TaxID=75290 RepID=A0ABW4FKL5_9PSEU